MEVYSSLKKRKVGICKLNWPGEWNHRIVVGLLLLLRPGLHIRMYDKFISSSMTTCVLKGSVVSQTNSSSSVARWLHRLHMLAGVTSYAIKTVVSRLTSVCMIDVTTKKWLLQLVGWYLIPFQNLGNLQRSYICNLQDNVAYIWNCNWNMLKYVSDVAVRYLIKPSLILSTLRKYFAFSGHLSFKQACNEFLPYL